MFTGSLIIPEKLNNKLKQMSNYPVTFIEAPTGFGKTTAIKDFSQNSTVRFKWINITTMSKDIFWADFCDLFGENNPEIENNLRTIEFPASEKAVAAIKTILKNITVNEDTFCVIDNYQMIGDDYFDLLINVMSDILPLELHFIFITQALTSDISFDFIHKDVFLHITKEDMAFLPEDIINLFSSHNLKLSMPEANQLYEFSEGWISAIYLQMMNYNDKKSIDDKLSINNLVEETVWNKLTDSEKRYMIILSQVNHFTLKEAKMIIADHINEEYVEKFFKNLIFIRFDKSNRNYYIHHIFSDYLNNEFSLLLPSEQNEIKVKIGNIYLSRNQLFLAYKEYYEADKWELIYKSVPSFVDLYPYINKDNKAFFISLVTNCPDDIREKYYYFSIIMCFVLFMYNEKERLLDYLMNIVYSIEDNNNLSDRQKRNLLGTVYFVRGYTEFNNISMMNEFYKKSLDYSGTPIQELTSNIPFNFGCPSILHIFHRQDEYADDEINELNECMPNYYRLSGGHGKGAEALMKAEILFNRGDFNGAETLCHKALYMADSRSQTCITISAMLLLSRMNIIEGDFDNYNDCVNNLKKRLDLKTTVVDSEYINMMDMCESFLFCLFDEKEKITEWLRDWESIERRINLISLSFANIIYGKWLFLNGEYQKLLGISGQFIGISSIFSFSMPNIYTYIYIAMSNYALDNKDKATKMIKIALDYAMKDGFIMPFVENEKYLNNLLEEIISETKYKDFIKSIRSFSKKYAAGIKTIGKNAHNKDNYGLTAREIDVAKLAAERYTNKEIATKLFIAESTVKSNLKVIFNKLGISSRSELSDFFK